MSTRTEMSMTDRIWGTPVTAADIDCADTASTGHHAELHVHPDEDLTGPIAQQLPDVPIVRDPGMQPGFVQLVVTATIPGSFTDD